MTWLSVSKEGSIIACRNIIIASGGKKYKMIAILPGVESLIVCVQDGDKRLMLLVLLLITQATFTISYRYVVSPG